MATPQKTEQSRTAHERDRGSRAIQRQPMGESLDYGFGPFSLFRRMQDDFDRLFGTVGRSRDWLAPFGGFEGQWAPAIDAFQRGNEFIVRADVPGLSKDDISIEIGDDALTIRGERKDEHEEEREGIYRSERSYGSFTRVVPLPLGAIADSAKANFRNGVLEIVMQAPSQEVRRGRRIEIGDEAGSTGQGNAKKESRS